MRFYSSRRTLLLIVLVTSLYGGHASGAVDSVAGEERTLLQYRPAACPDAEAADLPAEARFLAAANLFTWLPGYGDAGTHQATFNCAGGNTLEVTLEITAATPLPVTSDGPRAFLATTETWADDGFRNDQQSLRVLLETQGLAPTSGPVTGAALDGEEPPEILVLPWHVADSLDPTAVDGIVGYVHNGGRLLLSGRSALSEALGIAYRGSRYTVNGFVDYLNPAFPLSWSSGEEIDAFDLAPGDAVFTAAPTGSEDLPLAIGRRLGEGRVLYLATRHYDRHSAYGTRGHPYLTYHFADFFKLHHLLSAGGLEVYFEPGNYDLSQVLVEDLVARWASLGIQTVYTAAWHFWVDEDTGAEWDFAYDHFIRVCHQHGIRVYAWFAFPHVSQRFWEQTPECREQTAGNGEEYIFWRLMVNLQNQGCRDAALLFLRDMISAYDWDGLNIAELYYDFESDLEFFTPMNADLRADYLALHAVDPVEFFDPSSPNYFAYNGDEWERFLAYREQLVSDLHEEFLATAAANLEAGEVVATVVDNLGYGLLVDPDSGGVPVLDTGVDIPAVLNSAARHDVTVQIEDPWTFWSLTPERYQVLRDAYREQFPFLDAEPERLFFDVNVVDLAHTVRNLYPGTPPFPAPRQTGGEFVQIFQDLHRGDGRMVLFSENSAEPLDLTRLGRLLTADSPPTALSDTTFITDTRGSTRLHPRIPFGGVLLDGVPWPCWSGTDASVLLPAGSHQVELVRESTAAALRVVNLGGELLGAKALTDGVEVSYRSPRRKAVLSLEAYQLGEGQALRVTLDDAPYTGEVYDYFGHFHLFLPPGEHTVRVTTEELPAAGDVSPPLGQQDRKGVCFLEAAGFHPNPQPGFAAGALLALGLVLGLATVLRRRRR